MNSNRRQFLQHMGVAGLAASQLNWLSANAQADADSDYCALVCILLAGGADSFNMLLPYASNAYAEYAAIRADLALPRETMIPLATSIGDPEYAVHPGMSELADLYASGDVAFVANVGPLAEPTSRAAFEAGSVRLPLGLFSHSDQIAVWQTATAGERGTTGFGGRMSDILADSFSSGPISMNVSLSGANLFQTGTATNSYALGENGVNSIAGYGEADNQVLTQAFDRLLALPDPDPFRGTYRQTLRGAIDAGTELSAALSSAPELQTMFGSGELSRGLAQVARVISARELLGAQRQTFFITVGGWDHHDEVLDNQARMLPGISQGLAEFHAALTEMGLVDAVTTFTISDFGRTLTSNGRGSDHGWGGNNIVMGGAVNGGQIFGTYPELAAGNDLDVGRGRLLPTTSVDEFYADLALWFGIAPSAIADVLPNLGRFRDVTQGPPLGLLG